VRLKHWKGNNSAANYLVKDESLNELRRLMHDDSMWRVTTHKVSPVINLLEVNKSKATKFS